MEVPKPIGESVDFTCPFCGVTDCRAYENAVIHPTPICTKYLLLEPDEFLAAVNDSKLKS